MSNLNLDNAVASDMTNAVADVTVDPLNTDGATGQKETTWQNTKWSQQWGYFNQVPDLKTAIILKSKWHLGRGYTTDNPRTEVILDHIKGMGKDSWLDILKNMDIIRMVGGDSFAEIVRAEGVIVNLKPLDPGTIKIVVNDKGQIIRYEQTSKNPDDKSVIKFNPEDIFHLSNNRLADQIHGISEVDALEATIKAANEFFTDQKLVMHRGARPMILWKLKTDNTSKINAFVAKIDAARNLGEDMFIPDDEDIVSHEVVQVSLPQGFSSYEDILRGKFYRNITLPQIVPGAGGQSTESESKVIYTAHEQIVAAEQLYLETQIWQQLYLRIKLNPPTSFVESLQTDTAKDGSAAFQSSDVTAGVGR